MVIHGLQKMTLLDFPGKVAATVFTAGCNYKCPFCHNASLVTKLDKEDQIDEDYVLSFLQSRKGLLDGICLTGGEPLMQKDVIDFLSRVKEMGFSIKLDTNGSFPERLRELINKNLIDYVAMDLKNSFDKYLLTIDTEYDFRPKVNECIDILLNGDIEYEFRTTVCNELHEVYDIEKIAERIRGAKHYFIQPFNDSGNLIKMNTFTAPNEEKLKKMEEVARKYVFSASLRGI